MTAAVLPARVPVSAIVAGVVALGVLTAVEPLAVVLLIGGGLLVAFAFAAPVANLVVLVAVTAAVPYSVQNRLGGGAGSVGLILSDALLIPALVRAFSVAWRRRHTARETAGALVILAFLVVAVLQFVRGGLLGRDISNAGAELRTLVGIGAFFAALPLLGERSTRDRLLKGLLGVGALTGGLGLVLWFVGVDYRTAGFGVREGVAYTTAGRGQLQDGMYAFPVAATACWGALLSGLLRSPRLKTATVAVLGLNMISLLLTFERTFWVATILGFGFVAVRAGSLGRIRAVVWAAMLTVVAFVGLLTFSPSTLATARERFLSIGQYRDDGSLRYRIVESGHVIDEIAKQPVMGRGLGATIFWGRPWHGVPPTTYTYSHNGYLWLAWKIGLPTALLLSALIGWAIASRPPPGDAVSAVARTAAQAGLLVLMLVNGTFPSFNTYSITVTMGLLLALALAASPEELERRRRPADDATTGGLVQEV